MDDMLIYQNVRPSLPLDNSCNAIRLQCLLQEAQLLTSPCCLCAGSHPNLTAEAQLGKYWPRSEDVPWRPEIYGRIQ